MWIIALDRVLLACVLALALFVLPLEGYRKHELCEGSSSHGAYVSCRKGAKKLRVMVVDWGVVDAGTGASNRHLEILASLGMLGHDVRATCTLFLRLSTLALMSMKLPLAPSYFHFHFHSHSPFLSHSHSPSHSPRTHHSYHVPGHAWRNPRPLHCATPAACGGEGGVRRARYPPGEQEASPLPNQECP